MPQKHIVKCPTCQKEGEWFAGPFGPFCSHRCKTIDLGKWLNEEHVISDPIFTEDDYSRKVPPPETD
ncbi:MAG TPA: DNA gyrase inhibitor YacG [Verrucomicrobiae bacterium]|nr:DNA gyrase inhibitor YacG [Verrucomicrobiae bacterium]